MLLLIVWIVVVVLALVVLGAIAYGVLGAAGRLRRELAGGRARRAPAAADAGARPPRSAPRAAKRLNRARDRRARTRIGPLRRSIAGATHLWRTRHGLDSAPPEIGLIILAILLLFGYKKLPDASRSLGRSLRIFKGEMKGMKDDDVRASDEDAAQTTPGPRRDRRPRRPPARPVT